jgi:hypothetical protein
MQGSLQHISQHCLLHETLQDLASVMKNGGNISGNVSIRNSIAIMNTGSISYSLKGPINPFINGLTIRTKGIMNSTGIIFGYSTRLGNRYMNLSCSGTFNFYTSPAATTVNLSSFFGKQVDIVISGVVAGAFYLYINGSLFATSAGIPTQIVYNPVNFVISFGLIQCNLGEVYGCTLSASEILLLYQQNLYNDPTK